MKDLVAAINRLADVGEAVVAALTTADVDPPSPTETEVRCAPCDGAGALVDGRQCMTCVGRGRIRVA